jgi:hypothetical protein
LLTPPLPICRDMKLAAAAAKMQRPRVHIHMTPQAEGPNSTVVLYKMKTR